MYLAVIQGKGAGSGWDLESEVQVARRFINSKSPVIFDVGAHTGSWSRAIMNVLDADYHIYQFEPAEQNISYLRNSTNDKVTLIEKAVSKEVGKADFYFAKEASDTSSLHSRRESIFKSHEYDNLKVETTTIDKIIKKFDINTIEFLKLDIEGNELNALKGASQSLKDGRVKTLTFEFGSGNINSRTFFRDFWDLLTPLGYSIKRICPGGLLLPIEKYYEDLEYFRNVTNYVAILDK
jgi:FkbM family methyltransferase